MEVLSVNIGAKKQIKWKGKDVFTGIFKKPVDSIYLEKNDVKDDIVCDRKYHGGIDKACYLFSSNHYKYWESLYPNLDFETGFFGENVTINNLNEQQIYIGDIFRLGGATIQVTQPRQPCFKLGVKFGTQKIIKQFINYNSPGVYVKVLETASVSIGDTMELVERMHDSISVIDIWHLLYQDNFDEEKMEAAINNPFLAESCKKSLLKRIKFK